MIRQVDQKEWPIVDGDPWDENRYVRKDKWDQLPADQRADILLKLASRGRMVRPITVRGESEVLIHTSKPEPTELSVVHPGGVSLVPATDYVRHAAIVSVRIEVDDYKEAVSIFREWLEDMAAIGIAVE